MKLVQWHVSFGAQDRRSTRVDSLTRQPHRKARMFSIDDFIPATLTSVNPRGELHGDERKPACDLHFSIKTTNSVLSVFGPRLRDSIYWNSGDPAQQGELIEPLSDKPNLKNPMLEGPLKLSTEGVGYELTIDHGLGGKSNLVLGECNVNAFKVDAQEGGTVILGFRVQCHPGEKEAGRLAMLVSRDVAVKLTPPEVEQQLDEVKAPAKTQGKALDGTK